MKPDLSTTLEQEEYEVEIRTKIAKGIKQVRASLANQQERNNGKLTRQLKEIDSWSQDQLKTYSNPRLCRVVHNLLIRTKEALEDTSKRYKEEIRRIFYREIRLPQSVRIRIKNLGEIDYKETNDPGPFDEFKLFIKRVCEIPKFEEWVINLLTPHKDYDNALGGNNYPKPVHRIRVEE